jgi:uncharacterized membrane protein
MMPSFVLATILGAWMVIDNWVVYSTQYWLHAKLALVVPLIAYHFYCDCCQNKTRHHNAAIEFTLHHFKTLNTHLVITHGMINKKAR